MAGVVQFVAAAGGGEHGFERGVARPASSSSPRRRRARISLEASRKTLVRASVRTRVPMSRPAITTGSREAIARWRRTSSSRTSGMRETSETDCSISGRAQVIGDVVVVEEDVRGVVGSAPAHVEVERADHVRGRRRLSSGSIFRCSSTASVQPRYIRPVSKKPIASCSATARPTTDFPAAVGPSIAIERASGSGAMRWLPGWRRVRAMISMR